MSYIKKLVRLAKIYYICLKYGLDDILLTLPLPNKLRYVCILLFNRFGIRKAKGTLAERLRKALENLGPIFVKCGQLLSTRLDVLPEDMAYELIKLQDRVQPFSGETAKLIIEFSFGMPIHKIFKYFEKEPIASASIAQVHAAITHNNKQVVVKILRPEIRKLVQCDIELLETIASLSVRFSKSAQQWRIDDVLKELKKSIFNELDLIREGANAANLRRNFINSGLLYIPKIHWELTCKDILVMERIYGTPVTDIKTLKARGVNLKLLAERGVEIFFTQVFRDCFFHADMHPGNIWVDVSDPNNPSYLGLDFGIMGTLGPEDQHYLAANLLAFFQRDYRKVAELHVDSKWVTPHTRIDEFESAIRTVCEPIFERPLSEISFGKTLMHLFETAKQFNLQVQPQLILLQKTLVSVEGLGRQLYPDLDLWSTAKFYIENWMKKQIDPKNLIAKFCEFSPVLFEKFPEIANLIYKRLKEPNNVSQTQRNKDIQNSNNLPFNSKLYLLVGIIVGYSLSIFLIPKIIYL